MTDIYNGWANRETWATYMHLTNEEYWYNFIRDDLYQRAKTDAERADNPHPVPVKDLIRFRYTDAIKDTVERAIEDVFFDHENCVEWARNAASDIGSLWRVDWIAKAFLAELEEDAA